MKESRVIALNGPIADRHHVESQALFAVVVVVVGRCGCGCCGQLGEHVSHDFGVVVFRRR